MYSVLSLSVKCLKKNKVKRVYLVEWYSVFNRVVREYILDQRSVSSGGKKNKKTCSSLNRMYEAQGQGYFEDPKSELCLACSRSEESSCG